MGLTGCMPSLYPEMSFIHLDWKKQHDKNKQVDLCVRSNIHALIIVLTLLKDGCCTTTCWPGLVNLLITWYQ